MKICMLLLLMLVIMPVIGLAQDADSPLSMHIACQPNVILPDSNINFRADYDLPEYLGEQLVQFCMRVEDAVGNVLTDPQIEGLQIFVNNASGAVPLLLPPFDPQSPGIFPLEIILLLDSSGSMQGRSVQMQQAARQAVRRADIPNATYAIVSFNTEPIILQRFTADDDLIEAAINAVNPVPDGDTCLYDAVDFAADLGSTTSNARRIILLFTDGENNDRSGVCRLTQPDDSAEKAIIRGAQIYAIGLPGTRGVSEETLNALTVPTNGATYTGGIDDLPTLFDRVLRQLNGIRVLSALICGRDTVTITVRATINEQTVVSQALDVDLSSRGECLAPTPIPEATPTVAATLPPLAINIDTFDIQLDSQGLEVANISVSVPPLRTDIASVRAQIIDSASISAPRAPQECQPSSAGAFQCAIDVTALTVGQIDIQLTLVDRDGNLLLQQPFSDDRQKPSFQPVLQITPQGEDVLVSINQPGAGDISPVSAASFIVRAAGEGGVQFPVPGNFQGSGPYLLSMATVNTDQVTIEGVLTYGAITRRTTVTPFLLQRTLGQGLARFLRDNTLLIGAIVAAALGVIGWSLWRRGRRNTAREDDWLRNSVPDMTAIHEKSTTPSGSDAQTDGATRLYDAKPSLGELVIERLVVDPSREGSRVPIYSPFTVGRAASCQLAINDDYLSRTHLEISNKEGVVFVRDLGSSNGTEVNGKRLSPQVDVPLQHGAEIALGRGVLLRFYLVDDVATRMMTANER